MKTVRREHVALKETAETPAEAQGPLMQLSQTLLDLVSSIPAARERGHAEPGERAKDVIRAAKTKAALASGSLALPPGPLGWVTVLPEIYAVWKIQAQMVSDLAALHGRKSSLSREQMLYCLFRHTGAQLFRDLVMRVGERYLVRRLPVRSLYSVVNKIGIRLTQRSIARAVSRFVPVAGAVGIAGYSWYDTRQVARTAMELFSHEIEVEPVANSGTARRRPAAKSAKSSKPAKSTNAATSAKAGKKTGKPRRKAASTARPKAAAATATREIKARRAARAEA
jgi:hypothetical protein